MMRSSPTSICLVLCLAACGGGGGGGGGGTSPQITSATSASVVAGTRWEFPPTAENKPTDAEWVISGDHPRTMVIDAQTGLLSWQTALEDRGVWSFDVTIRSVQNPALADTARFVLLCVLRVEFLSSPPATVQAGRKWSYQPILTNSPVKDIAWSIDPRGGTPPGKLEQHGKTGLLGWPTVLADAGKSYTFKIKIAGSKNLPAEGSQTVTVECVEPAQKIHITAEPPTVVMVGAQYRYAPTYFADKPLAKIQWVPKGAPTGMTVDPNTGFVTWQPAEKDFGDHTVTLVASGRSQGGKAYHGEESWTLHVGKEDVLGSASFDVASGGTLQVRSPTTKLTFSVTVPPHTLSAPSTFTAAEILNGADDPEVFSITVRPGTTLNVLAPQGGGYARHEGYATVAIDYDPALLSLHQITASQVLSKMIVIAKNLKTGVEHRLPIDSHAGNTVVVRSPILGGFKVFPLSPTWGGATEAGNHNRCRAMALRDLKGTGAFVSGKRNLLFIHGYETNPDPRGAINTPLYQRLVRFLTQQNATPGLGYDHVIFADYDTWKGVVINARQLATLGGAPGFKQRRDKLLGSSETKYDILAYSQGGVIARYALEAYRLPDVRRLITVSSPHEGTFPHVRLIGWLFNRRRLLGPDSYPVKALTLGRYDRRSRHDWPSSPDYKTTTLAPSTEYTFVVGNDDLVVSTKSARAEDRTHRRINVSNRRTFVSSLTKNSPNYVTGYSSPFYGVYGHLAIIEDVHTNGVGHFIANALWGVPQLPKAFDVDRDGDVDLDDYAIVFVAGTYYDYDPRDPRIQGADKTLMHRYGVSQAKVRGWIAKADVNGDGLWDPMDVEVMEAFAEKGFLALHPRTDASVYAIAPSKTYNGTWWQVGHDGSGEWRSFLSFGRKTEWVTPWLRSIGLSLPGWKSTDSASCLFLLQGHSPGRRATLQIREVKSPWIESAVSWAKQPSFDLTLLGTIQYSKVSGSTKYWLGPWKDLGFTKLVERWRTDTTNTTRRRGIRVSATWQSGWYSRLIVPSRDKTTVQIEGNNYRCVVLLESKR